MSVVLPEYTVGILGGGQLGRMFCHAASAMGYRTVVFDPDEHSPAGAIADIHICAPYNDNIALSELSECCDVISIEFENVPTATLAFLEQNNSVHPAARCLQITADRIIEKNFCQDNNLQTTPFAAIETKADISTACNQITFPAILKTARLGYDGKGQVRVEHVDDIKTAFASLQASTQSQATPAQPQIACVLEQMVNLKMEVSVVLARKSNGDIAHFNVAENIHRDGVLDVSITPARIDETLANTAKTMASQLAEAMDYIGVMAVEFFIDQADNVLINEIAPRPHNSGHPTMNGCATSQFEQQVRAICNLPLGSTHQHSPCVMVNLLGDIWPNPDFEAVLKNPNAKLHLYGKSEARAGRKMGHINCLGNTVDEALALALNVKDILGIPHA